MGQRLGTRERGPEVWSCAVRGPRGHVRAQAVPGWHVTCFSGSSMNSSVLATSTKCCSTYLCAAFSRSLHECESAKPRMPRQLEGSSWLSRNLQQASRTPFSCRRLAAGSRVCGARWERGPKAGTETGCEKLRGWGPEAQGTLEVKGAVR